MTIDPGAVIGPRAEIGARTVIAAGACIGPDVRIGRDCAIGAGAALINALIGDRVIIHSGARIGHDGYGFTPGPKGLEKIPQVGRVIVQDDVEIGTNTTIDRGGIRDTVIGEGSKIDNLVQIGHNVTIGRHCILAGHVGISGSVTIGDYAVLGGKVGIADHVIIGEGASVTAGSGVMHDIGAGERWGGYPATTAREWMRGVALLRRLLRHDHGKGSDGGGVMTGETLDVMGIKEILCDAPASLSVPAGRPHHRYPRRRVRHRHQECDHQRTALHGPFSEPAGDARACLCWKAWRRPADILAMKSLGQTQPKLVYFLTIDKAKFRKPVMPGDVLEYHMERLSRRRNMWWYRGKAKVGGDVVAEAELGAMIAEA